MKKIILATIFTISLSPIILQAQSKPVADSLATTVVQRSDSTQIPANALKTIELVNVKNMPIKDLLRGLGTQHHVNVFVDDDVTQNITLRLQDIRVHDVIAFVVKENDLDLSLENGIYKISMPEIQAPEPQPLKIECQDGLLTIDIKQDPLEKVLYEISEKSGRNIILNRGVEGRISGFLQKIPFEKGLSVLLSSNGFTVRQKDGVYLVDREYRAGSSEGNKNQRRPFWIDVKDSLITLEVTDGDLNEVVMEAANQLGVDIFVLSPMTGKVHAQCKQLPFDDILDYLFKGTNYTYRKDGAIYLIGEKTISGMVSTELIKLNHIKADGIIEILPQNLTAKATVQIIKEHNSLMVVGSQDVINEVRQFIQKIDYPIPQILIEAVVVDFTTTDAFELGVTAGTNLNQDTSSALSAFDLFYPNVDMTLNESNLNASLQYNLPKIGIKNIGRLPPGFMVNLQAMEQKGKANVRSVPQIATLNGHPASIKIGTTQYYQLESYTPYASTTDIYRQTSQRFEQIEANISLSITPWVSASGEITAEIKPEFNTPRNFNPKVPPTIDTRTLESTVRLRDGETIILGGLIQSNDSETHYKFPILGNIPGLGQLFRNRSKNKSKTKLMIYITPHLMYSSDDVLIHGIEE